MQKPVIASTASAFNPVVDINKVADFAAEVGNRRVGTSAERAALSGAELLVGLRFGDLTDSLEYQYTATGWVVAGGLESTANVTVFGTGWSITPGGGHVPRLHRQGRLVTLHGAVTLGAGGNVSNMLTIPTSFRPPNASTRFIGGQTSSGGVSYELALSGGVVSVPSGYLTGNFVVGTAYPLFSSWILD